MSVCLYYSLSYPASKSHFSAPFYIVICVMLGCTIFFHISHKLHEFKKKVMGYKTFVLIFSEDLSQTFLILTRIRRDIIIKLHTASCEVPVFLVRFLIKCKKKKKKISTDFRKKFSNNKSHKNPSSWSWVVSCKQRDRRTDRERDLTKLTIAFINLSNVIRKRKNKRWWCILKYFHKKHVLLKIS